MSAIPCYLFFKERGRWKKATTHPLRSLREARLWAWFIYDSQGTPFKIERADKRRPTP